MSKIIDGIVKDLKAIPETLKAKTAGVDKKKLILMNLPYILAGYFCDKIAWLWRVSPGSNVSDKMMAAMNGMNDLFSNPLPSFFPKDLLVGIVGGVALRIVVYFKAKNANESKADKFVRLGEYRVNKVIDAIGRLENLFNRTNYEYTQEQVEVMFSIMEKRLLEVKGRFAPKKEKEDTFSFGRKAE